MGTPDLQGTFGTFTFFTDDPFASRRTRSPGGRIVHVNREQATTPSCRLEGPVNSLRKDRRTTSVEIAVHVDPGARCPLRPRRRAVSS